MNTNFDNQSIVVLYYLIFGVMWFAVGFVMSMISGWWELAGSFRASQRWRGKLLKYHTAELNSHPLGLYIHCLHFGVSPEGLFLRLSFPFRGSHPSLLVPWNEITVLEGTSGIIFKKKQILLGREQGVSLRINARLADQLKREAGTMWPREM